MSMKKFFVHIQVGDGVHEERSDDYVQAEHPTKGPKEFEADWDTARQVYLDASLDHTTEDIILDLENNFGWHIGPFAPDFAVVQD